MITTPTHRDPFHPSPDAAEKLRVSIDEMTVYVSPDEADAVMLGTDCPEGCVVEPEGCCCPHSYMAAMHSINLE